MWRIRRFYVDALGVRDNRFVDLTVDLTGTDGQPADSIVWLRNGAGKTTMLSLLIAHILPNRRDFLARSTGKKRTLEDLVLAADTGHVACEWVDPSGTVLLTGSVYEWDGRHRPRDYNTAEGRRGFQRRYWIVRADDTVEGATLDTLPFTTRTGGRVDLSKFAEHIRGLARVGVDAVVEGGDSTPQWHAALAQRRFDADLFRYFAIVNGTEGGLEHLFDKIDSSGAFARFMLQFVADPDRAVAIRNLLQDTAAEIAKRPAYEADREFSLEVAPFLEDLGNAHDRVVSARDMLDEASSTAAVLRRDLLDGAAAAETRAGTEDSAAAAAAERYLRASGERRTHRRLAENLRWAAARLGAEAAEKHHRTAVEHVARTKAEVAAWDAVAVLAELGEARATLDARTSERAEAHQHAAPYLERLDRATRQLRAGLDATIATGDKSLEEDRERLDGLRSDRERTASERDSYLSSLAGLSAEREAAEETVAAFDSEIAAAVADGYLGTGEAPAAAEARHRSRRDELTTAVTARGVTRGKLDAELTGLDARVDAARRTALTVRDAAARTAAGHRQRVARAEELAAHPRIIELAQTETVDVDSEVRSLVTALADALADTEAHIIEEGVDGATDQYALDALKRTGLLPPRRAVSDLVEVLDGLGHRAWPGWVYLAERIRPEEHAALIARYPDVCEGVVVYDDPKVVAATLDEEQVSSPDAIVVARASIFTADSGSATSRVVVGPSEARHNTVAAAAELAARRSAVEAREQKIATLKTRFQRDTELSGDLGSFLASVPEGGLAASEQAVIAAEQLAVQREAEATAAEEAVEHQRAAIKALDEQVRLLHQELNAVAVAFSVAGGLASRAPAVAAKAQRLEEVGAEIGNGEVALRERNRRLGDLDVSIRRLEKDIDRQAAALAEWRRDVAALPDAAGADPGTEPLDVLKLRASEAQRALDDVLNDRDLSASVTDAQRAVQRITDRLKRFDQVAVTRACQLITTPDATDDDARHRARTAAEDAYLAAEKGEALAGQAVEEAGKNEIAARPERYVSLDPAPATATGARDRAEAVEATAAEWQRKETDAEAERNDAEARAGRCRTRAGLLRDQADKLRAIDPSEHGSGRPLAEDDTAVRSLVADVGNRFEDAVGKHQSALTDRSRKIERIRLFATQDRFVHLSETEHGRAIRQVRAMVLGDDVVEKIAPNALDLAVDLIDRADKIDTQLERIDQHKRNVVARLVELVHVGLGDLARVSRLSELPELIGPWAGRQFIRVGHRGNRPTADQMEVRVGELVDDMVTGGKVEIEPIELLWQATRAAVGPGGFHASILKPTPEQGGDHVPVTEMSKWSGGETLTASLIIFCVMTRLRAENRHGGSRSRIHAGVVPLDNPVGKANYREFLQLQRRVAAANGAQLLFWTGIGDLGAITTFPRIVAMRKAISATRTGAAYVGPDEDRSLRAPDDIDGLRVEVSPAARDERSDGP